MARKNSEADFALMDVLSDDVKLARAVISVGDESRKDGYREGWKARGDYNSMGAFVTVFASFLLGVLAHVVYVALF